MAIFIGFGWIAYDRQSTRDYLNDLESGWKPRRVQAAYELSKILVSDPLALQKEEGAKAQVRRLFQEADDPEMKRYLALVLGRTGDQEALPCSSSLDDEDERTRSTRSGRSVCWAPTGQEPLTALGDQDPAPQDRGVRVGELNDPSVVPASGRSSTTPPPTA